MFSAGKWALNPDLHPRIQAALQRVSLSPEEVLALPSLLVQKATGLSRDDEQKLRLKTQSRTTVTQASRLTPSPSVSWGCPFLDQRLGGGLPVGGITELFGHSAAGKTQLALQLCLSVQYPPQYGGLASGAVFICTEDPFPSKRLQQLISEQSSLRPQVPLSLTQQNFSDRVYVEHTADLPSLIGCLSRRVPVLVSRGLVRLLVVDSIAALFRTEFEASDWLNRHHQLLAVSSELQRISRQLHTAVLCINQAVDLMEQDHSLSSSPSSFGPALGLAWSNQVTMRLMMRREAGLLRRGDQSSAHRSLQVVYAPHLPAGQSQGSVIVGVWREGLRGEGHLENIHL
ncbi:unnamed protein product [Knipowitschia caucasica]|uniref:RecA family profile 1 domain-containing protein n=1 Tax=Knipowitschia caucasica TaxID=637954 RepID=A0AAV2J400_KNICA